MSFQSFPIADFKNGLFSARDIWLAPGDAFAKLENASIDRGIVKKRPGYKTMGYFPERLGNIVSLDDTVSPVSVELTGHGLATNDVVILQSMAGWTDGNNLKYVITKTDNNNFTLNGTTGTSAYSSAGTVDQLISLTYSAPIAAAGISKPSVDNPGSDTLVVITTSSAHGLSTGDKVLISGDFQNPIVGMGQINNTVTTIQVNTTTTFSLDNVNTVNYDAHTSGGDIFLVNSTANNKIMGIHELFKDEADNVLIVNSEDRTAKYSESLSNLVAVSTSDDWTGSNTQLFQMANGFDRLWMTNFKDGVKTTDGSTITTVTFDTLGNTGNDVNRAKFVFPFDNRMCLLNTVESSTLYPQRLRWSRINYGTGDSTEWDSSASSDDTTAGSLDAATDEEIVSFALVGDDVVVFFERSIWAIKKTGSFDLPFRWKKLAEAPDVFSSPFSTSQHGGVSWALSRHGLLATDGIQTIEVDAVIPRWYEAIDDENFRLAYGSKLFKYDQNWTTYADNGNDATRNDSTKVYNYKDKTFADYKFGYNCMGEYTIASKASTLWSTLETMTWGEVESSYSSWGEFYAGKGAVDNVFGDDTGRIFRVDGGPNDDGAIIPVTIESSRLNPFKDKGLAAQLGWVDILFTRNDATSVEISFSVDFDNSPINTQKIDLSPDGLFVDNNGPMDKVWKRVYVNLVGNTHQIKMVCDQQSSNFELHAMVPFFKPQGRVNML